MTLCRGKKIRTTIIVGLMIITAFSALITVSETSEANTGGPDAFGYTWTDSKLPAPTINYNWVEISGTGTRSSVSGDDSYGGPFSIGFSFNFYGNSYSQLYFSTNGLVTFGVGSSSLSNTVIPSTSGPENFIALYWDDLYVPSSGGIYYQLQGSAPNRQFIIEYYHVQRLGSANLMTFEVILKENSQILIQYNSLNGQTGTSASVGIENSIGNIGLQYSYNSPSLSDNLAILFSAFTIDFIVIKNSPGPGGSWVGNSIYSVGNSDTFYAQGFNNTQGYIEDVNAAWTSNNPSVATVSTPGSSTTLNAVGEGTCNIIATYSGTLTNTTGIITVGIAPEIKNVIHIPEYPNGTTMVTALANLTDIDGIGSATLYYSYDGISYTSIAMSPIGGGNYSANIPGPGSTTVVYFYIEATDTNGFFNSSSVFSYIADSNLPQFGIPVITPANPNETVDVNVTINVIDDTEIINATLYYSYDGITWDNTSMSLFGASGTFYEYQVESGPSGWTHYQLSGPAGDDWAISSARSMSPVNSWYSGQEPVNNNNWGDSCLESPLFTDLPLYSNLTFWHWYDFYSFPIDGCIVEINDGSGWNQITPVDGYDGTLSTGWQNPLEGKPAFTSSSGGWQQETFDLSAYGGKDIKIRFHIGWNNFDEGREGWYIDDISLYTDFGGCNGIIPGPGYSTWVYYYVVATDQANNTNNSITYSYYADGTDPIVVDTSDIISPVATNTQVSIFANVTDDYGLDFNSVCLWYDNGNGWTGIPMNFVSGNYTNATFQAYIPEASAEATVYYYVRVMDNASNDNNSITKNYLTNFPPFIENVTHIPEYPNGTSTVIVYADIIDGDGVNSATLYYSTDGTTYTPTPMNFISGNTWDCTVPISGFTTTVYYYITAIDTNGFINSSPIFNYSIDADKPELGIPSIDPQSPNGNDDVDVTINIYDNIGVANATLWYSYDGVNWLNTSMDITGLGGSTEIIFEDTFPTTVLDGSKWAWTVNSPVINTLGINEPSPPYSLELDGSDDTVTSIPLDLSSFDNVSVNFSYEMGGGGESPDSGDWLFFEYYNDIGNWVTLWSQNGDSSNHNNFDQAEVVLPNDAYHINFRLRFRSIGTGSNLDDFYVDDIRLISYGGVKANGTIPGPGCSTWVYYRIEAADYANNTNITPIYSYYVDGCPPIVVNWSTISRPICSENTVTVYANVTDDYALDYVLLWYNDGSGWSNVLMIFVSGNSTNATYRADIPPTHNEITVFYYVEVFDNASNSNSSVTESYITNFPPMITDVVHSPTYPNGIYPVEIYANITDSDGISSVILYYSTDGVTYTPTPMSVFSGITYNGTIPPAGAADNVYYFIRATDTNGFGSNSSVFSYTVDNQPPVISIPAIDPPYPNVSDLVNVSFMIVDDGDLGPATLYYSYDGVVWFTSPVYIIGGFGNILFNETFPTTMINMSNWGSTSSSPFISTLAYNEPTPPYSLELDATDDTITSVFIDLSNHIDVSINFSYEMGGGGNAPETSDWLYLDYYTSSGSWTNLWSQNGDGFNHNTFDEVGIDLPSDAYHSNFRFRFRSWGSSGDDFYIDDIKLISHVNAYAFIPGPGYPSRVYYHINATDKTGNYMDTSIYSYAVGPDLMLTTRNITFIPCPIENGNAVQINATIYNSGGSLTGVEVRFYHGNPDINNDNIIDTGAKEIGTPAIIDTQPNSIVFASTMWTPPKRDFYDIYVWVDAINATWEWDEQNNLASNRLAVYDWLDDFLDETKIEYKYDIDIGNGDATLMNIGNEISVIGTSYQWGVGGYWGYDYFAQSFIATSAMISYVGIYVGGDTNPYPDMRVQLWGDWGGDPDINNIIASSDVIKGSTITSIGQRYYINFSTPLQVTINQRYWVVIDGYYDYNTTGDCYARRNTANPYLDGVFKYSNNVGATWITSSTNYDLDFFVKFYEPVSDGDIRSVEITLPLGKTWETLYINKTEPTNTKIYISAWDGSTNNLMPGYADLTQNIIDISSIEPKQYPSIKLFAHFVGDGMSSPVLHYWAINWIPKPWADAGPDDFVDEDVPYTFNGSGSWSSIGIANYAWDINANDGIDWNLPDYKGSNLWNPTHTYYTPGVYMVTLNVTDVDGYWDIDTMILTVNDLTPPVVDAGSDDITNEDSPYTFDAGGSRDNSGTIASYLWDIDERDGIDWDNPDYIGVSPTHIFSEPGTYIVTLNVSDAAGNWNVTKITIIVSDITSPTADAGFDGSINEDEIYYFDGTRSTDNVGIVSYYWAFGDGSYDSDNNVITNHTYTSEGRYVVILKVMDKAGNWDEDTITIYVNNVPPVATAGEDLTVNEDQIVIFDGSNSSDTPSDNSSLIFIWYFGDGFVGAGSKTTHIYEDPGIYIVTLIVSDNNGAISSDTLTVTVMPTSMLKANAGPDGTVNQNSPYTFDGSRSFDTVGIVNYAWDIDASDGIDWQNPDYSGVTLWNPVHTYSEPTAYIVTLNVTNTTGCWDIDSMVLTVVDITPPAAEAGQDASVEQNIPYRFNGSGSTDNVGIITYQWDIDAGDGIDWSSPDYVGPTPMHVYTEPRVYVVTLRVIDHDGNSGIDTLTIEVTKAVVEESIPSAPTELKVLLLPRNDALELRWQAPTTNLDGSSLFDLDHYEIYYRAGENQDFKKLTDTSVGTTSYIHSGLTANAIYYYYVVAVDKNSTRSPESITVSRMPNVDTDGDQTPDITDLDDDNDGYPDSEDDYPLDPTKWKKVEEKAFDWLWILIGLIVLLLCIIGLLTWKTYKGVGAGPMGLPKRTLEETQPPPPSELPESQKELEDLPPIPPPPPPPPPPLETEHTAPQEESESVVESEEGVEQITEDTYDASLQQPTGIPETEEELHPLPQPPIDIPETEGRLHPPPPIDIPKTEGGLHPPPPIDIPETEETLHPPPPPPLPLYGELVAPQEEPESVEGGKEGVEWITETEDINNASPQASTDKPETEEELHPTPPPSPPND